jgi:hypothetical protein
LTTSLRSPTGGFAKSFVIIGLASGSQRHAAAIARPARRNPLVVGRDFRFTSHTVS